MSNRVNWSSEKSVKATWPGREEARTNTRCFLQDPGTKEIF